MKKRERAKIYGEFKRNSEELEGGEKRRNTMKRQMCPEVDWVKKRGISRSLCR